MSAPDPFANVVPFQPDADRDPPMALEAEQELLGALLINNTTTMSRIRGQVGADDFADSRHARIFTAAVAMIERGERADPITLKGQFERDESLREMGGAGYLARLASAATTVQNVGDYARHIREMAVRRRLIEVAQRLSARAWDDMDVDVRASDIASAAIEDLRRAGLDDVGFNFRTGRDVLIAELEAFDQPVAWDSTGFEYLDRALGGGLHRQTLVGFKARPKMGKTTLMGSISYNLAFAGIPHAYLWMEMSDRQLLRRQWAFNMSIGTPALRSDRLHQSPALRERAARAAAAWPECQIVPRKPIFHLDRIRDAIIVAKERYGIHGAFVDYLQLMRGQKRGQSRVEHMEECAQTLAEISKEEDVWICLAAQEKADGGTRWGEALDMACDHLFSLVRDPKGHDRDEAGSAAWVAILGEYARDMAPGDVGSVNDQGVVTRPGLILDSKGPMLVEPRREEMVV